MIQRDIEWQLGHSNFVNRIKLSRQLRKRRTSFYVWGSVFVLLLGSWSWVVSLADRGAFETFSSDDEIPLNDRYSHLGLYSATPSTRLPLKRVRAQSATKKQRRVLDRARSECLLLNPSAHDKDARALVTSIRDTAASYDLPSELLLAMIYVESRCRPDSRSNRGALGLMQVMPTTAKEMGFPAMNSARDNVHAGARYLAKLRDQFKGDIRLALAAYNAGPVAVLRTKGIPPYRETRHYTENVLRLYNELLGVAVEPIARKT